jgi:protein-tyrosine phosphatase
MVDLHSHLIYGVDDGVINLEQSINMIKAASANNYKCLITTPHYIEDSIYSSAVNKNMEIIKNIEEALVRENIDIKMYLGNEVMFSNNILDLLVKQEIIKLNNSRYLLIELPENISYDTLIDKIDLLISKDIVPIIAHPERYDYIGIDDLKEFVSHGALFR